MFVYKLCSIGINNNITAVEAEDEAKAVAEASANRGNVRFDNDYALRLAARSGHLDVVEYLEKIVAKN